MKTIYNTLGLLLIACVSFAQPSTSDYMEMAQEAFDKKHYNGAISHSRVAWRNEPTNTSALFLLIESEMAQNAYRQAEGHLHLLLDSLKSTEYADAYLYLAQIKQSTGNYEEAQTAYQIYLSENDGEDQVKMNRAQIGLSSSKWASNNTALKNAEIEVNRMDMSVNTEFSEHAPAMYNGKLFFTSLRFPLEGENYEPTRMGSKVLAANKNTDLNVSGSDPFNADDKLTSNLSLNGTEDKLVYSLCHYGGNDVISCDLYMRSKDSAGKWMPSVKLPDNINATGSTNTQASFGETIEGQTDFYFVSNREGSGGLDIYHSTFDENLVFSNPENLRSINTALDEVSPFYNYNDKYLYFSSDGQLGYGGFDVFKVTPDLENLENVGMPTNTSYNELFYRSYSTDEGVSSYIASNRPGSMYLNEKFETCCYDIYKVENEIKGIQLLANTFDMIQKKALNGTMITLEEMGNPSYRKEADLPETNSHRFDLDANSSYSVLVTKKGFEDAVIEVDAKSLTEALSSGTLSRDIYLNPLPVGLSVHAFKELDKSSLIGATARLQASGYEDQMLNNPRSNDFAFRVIPGVPYTLVVKREGYHDLTTMIEIPLDDVTDMNKDVYLTKITLMESLENLIPLTLFFDNDEPHPNSMVTTTELEYSDTFDKYYPKKAEFVDTYSKQFNRNDRDQKRYEMDNFFETDVKKSYNEFNYFVSTLIKILTKGKTVNIYLRGYASPLSKNDYNTALGQRRIASVKNEFTQHENGVLVPFINSGQLIITVRSFGEGTAKSGISDDPLHPEKAIFSLDASKERRVEIDEIIEVK